MQVEESWKLQIEAQPAQDEIVDPFFGLTHTHISK
jgi:hypothetical protein